MRNTLAIVRKELSIYFTTPWAYAGYAVMGFLSSFFFIAALSQFRQVQEAAKAVSWARMPPDAALFKNLTDGVIAQLWGVITILILFIAPFLSMRLFAEEKKQKTFELLMTTPVRPFEIVLGKYASGLCIIGSTLGITLVYPAILAAFGSSESGSALEWSTVGLGYLGVLLWGAAAMAIGMFVSSLTESQGVAAVITFVVLLLWMLLNGLATSVEEPWRSVVRYLSIDSQLQNLLKGVFDLKSLVFFLSIVVLSGLLTHRSIEAQRWT